MFYGQELPDPKLIYQGDIFKNQIIITYPLEIKILRLENEEKYALYNLDELDDAFQNSSTEACIVDTFRTNIMVLSQTCDIQSRDFISIAPIIPLDNIEKENLKDSIRKRKINYRLFLPEFNGFPESFVELTLINSIKKEILDLKNRINSLGDYGKHWLHDILYRYLCRAVYVEEEEYIKLAEDKL